MAIINLGNIASTIGSIKSLTASRGSPMSQAMSTSPKGTMASHGIGDLATSSYVKSVIQGSNTNFIWGVNSWGSKTYKVSS